MVALLNSLLALASFRAVRMSRASVLLDGDTRTGTGGNRRGGTHSHTSSEFGSGFGNVVIKSSNEFL